MYTSLAVLLTGCFSAADTALAPDTRRESSPDAPGDPSPDAPADPSGLWVNPDTPAARQVRDWRSTGRIEDAASLERIAGRPMAEWIGDSPRERAERITRNAAEAGRTPVLVAYHIPHRDCGNHSAGGAEGAAAYRAWVRELASGIGDRRAVVVVEPDAVAQVVDGCIPEGLRAERTELLRDAVSVLSALPAVKVYLDAGHSGWIDDIGRLAAVLRSSGVEQADGFALNVSNFQPTEAVEEYGLRLSRELGGAHFVIDTSRNGNGPLEESGGEGWCNPPGRRLGTPPTTRTGKAKLDAYLWIKRPGESDGRCNGGPAAGQWWPQYALGLVRGAPAGPRAGQG
ncbi:glycoside hydrolase family 6 protein [Streptomyces sp. MTZ3.1]|uniref:Glucanase n=1 Tax=Streptomyces meridianus TaxID=2938945 RepID=A0ABT0X6S7_9ACTN|nr:glycoside hydrolase family 6 protein [Streptomyces meridianus]MCM2578230.1 glycoside hydrolase family 6 protein [Streptomyces meridianus]